MQYWIPRHPVCFSLTRVLHQGQVFSGNQGLLLQQRRAVVEGLLLKLSNCGWFYLLVLVYGSVFVKTAIAVAPGEPAPNLALPLITDGSIVRLSDLKGKVVYIDFWASWCGPCRQSLPLYESLYKNLVSEHFQILAVNLDEQRDDAERFLKNHPVSYPVLLDPSGDSAREWSLSVMPSSYLVDAQGRLAYIYVGFEMSHMDKIEHDIKELLESLQGPDTDSGTSATGGLR